jgi:hypothetical protein
VYSDEGTNFVGAKKELAELQKLLQSATNVTATQDFLAILGIQFHTNPPHSPHRGGLWEAGVKSLKHHLRRVMNGHILTLEEFATLLSRVEAILNSRPLCPMSNDPNDVSVLTPGHFLVGRPLNALLHPDLTGLPSSRLDRWQEMEKRTQQITTSWKRDYLSQQQSRPKWFEPVPDLTPGTLVLILEDENAFGPQRWKLGRVTTTFPGSDGKVRSCDVRTNITPQKPKGTILHRDVTKLAALPIS